MKRYMGWIIIILVIGGTIACLIYLKKITAENKKLVDEKIIKNYFQALVQKSYESTWNYYNDKLKKEFPLAAFASHYQKISQDYGNLEKYNVYNVTTNLPFVKKKKYTTSIQYFYNKGMIAVTYTLTQKENGDFEIINVISTSSNFRYERMPW